MDKITWTVTEPNGDKKVVSEREPLPYREPVEITGKMSKGQEAFAQGYNEMRERLLELGEMKAK